MIKGDAHEGNVIKTVWLIHNTQLASVVVNITELSASFFVRINVYCYRLHWYIDM